ncbi:MAG: hypothetical protein ABIA97_06665 [Candidatus Omnitrophota bacterium]
MKRIFLILVIILLIILAVGRGYYFSNVKGYLNLRKCKNLKGGISKTELIKILGKPIQMQDTGNTMTLTFETPSIAAEPISAIVEKRSDIVFCIKCTENSKCK